MFFLASDECLFLLLYLAVIPVEFLLTCPTPLYLNPKCHACAHGGYALRPRWARELIHAAKEVESNTHVRGIRICVALFTRLLRSDAYDLAV